MEAGFRAPKRRTRVYEVYEGPLPLNQDHDQIRADLINQQVLVQDPEHIRTLYRQGFFGKGVLSKSGPAHNISDQWESHEGLLLPLVSRSRYEQLLWWSGQTLSAQGLDEEAVRHTLEQVSSTLTPEQVQAQTKDLPQTRDQSKTSEDQTSESKPESRPASGLESRPDPGFSVPGPGLVLVQFETENQIRRAPISLSESLQLSHEEAFFLVYALGCLTVYNRQVPLSVLSLWRFCVSFRSDFISSYAAYHFYRSRGWIPKTGSGAKYGADMMLYRKGPPFYHASYSVVVERGRGGDFTDAPLRPFSWRSLSALSRITTNVSKELLLCYVIFPLDQSEAELQLPDCLKTLTVQEVMVSRWVSSRERSESEEI